MKATTFAVVVLIVAFVAAGVTGWAGPATEAHGYDGAELRYDRQADGASNLLADSTRVDTREGRRSGVVSSTVGVAEAQNGVAAINPGSAADVGADGRGAAGHVGSAGLLFDDFVSDRALPICHWCQDLFGPSQFPPGVEALSNGPRGS